MSKILSYNDIHKNTKHEKINNLIDYLNTNEYSVLNNNNQKDDFKNDDKSILLSDSLISSLRSSNKEKLSWIITQKVDIAKTLQALKEKEDIIFLIDFLLEKLLLQKAKLDSLFWLEQMITNIPNKIPSEKISDIKIVLEQHSYNYNLIADCIARYDYLKTIKPASLKETKIKNNKEYVDNKHKIGLVYNETDSENEEYQKQKEKVSQKIKKNAAQKILSKKQKQEKEEDSLSEESNENHYMDVEDDDDKNSKDENVFEEDEDEDDN